MATSMQAGDVLADRYRLDDLLAENGAGRFWRAHDLVLHRPVSVHVLAADDERAEPLLQAARGAVPVINRVSAANFIALTTILKAGDKVYALAPAGGSCHPSTVRPISMAGAAFRQFHAIDDLEREWAAGDLDSGKDG